MQRIKSFDEFINNVTESKIESKKEIAGFKEAIEIVGLGTIKAKLDTGNTTKYNALIVQDYFEKDGKVKFNFNGKELEYDVEKHVRIWHHGKSTERPIIKVDLIFNGKKYKDELIDLKISDLTGTKSYRCRMLICKKFMEEANIIIDPSKEFNITKKHQIDKPRKKKVNESKDSENQVIMSTNKNLDATDIDFILGGKTIGGAILTHQYIDGIISEYQDSVDDFDESIFRKFDDSEKLYNLEDFWIKREYRGKGYSKLCLEKLMEKYGDKQMVLRAFPDGGVDDDTLVRIYSRHGFVVLQPTESDGTIMGKYKNKKE